MVFLSFFLVSFHQYNFPFVGRLLLIRDFTSNKVRLEHIITKRMIFNSSNLFRGYHRSYFFFQSGLADIAFLERKKSVSLVPYFSNRRS